MKYLPIGLLVAAVCLPAPASAGELALSFKDGRVTLKATDVTLRQVLNEWARLGQTRIVGLEKLGGGLLTLELTNVPEKQALEILLRSVAGYAAAPRASVAAGADMAANLSRFDRLMLLPTSIASAAPMAPPRPRGVCAATASAISGSDSTGQRGGRRRRRGPDPPGVPVFNPNGEPVTAGAPSRSGRADAGPASRAGRRTIRMPRRRPTVPTPAGDGAAGHDPPRRDPRAADATAPVSAGWVYSLPT